jgi:hypothetical protein
MSGLVERLLAFDPTSENEERETAALLDDLAERIVSRHLETPAVLFLETGKPLAFLAGQSLVLATPLLGAFVPPDRLRRLAGVLDSPDRVEELLACIEARAAARDRGTEPSPAEAAP